MINPIPDHIYFLFTGELKRLGVTPQSSLLAAVSGGVDSTAMLLLLHQALINNCFTSLYACHIDHRLRPGSETIEMENLLNICHRLNIPLYQRIADVPAEKLKSESTEQAARRLRYQALENIRREIYDTSRNKKELLIATAHSADDQAETVLLRMIRGSGARGLAAILPATGKIIRPILGLRRKQLIEILDIFGVKAVEDHSNQDISFDRNRLRHRVMPFLEREFPSSIKSLCRVAAIQKLLSDYLEKESSRLFLHHIQPVSNCLVKGFTVGLSLFQTLQQPLQEQLIQEIAAHMGLNKLNSRHIFAIVDIALSERDKSLTLPDGCFFRRAADNLEFVRVIKNSLDPLVLRPGDAAEYGLWSFRWRVLSEPCEPGDMDALSADKPGIAAASFEEAGSIISVTGTDGEGYQLHLGKDFSRYPLTIRSRKPGDRISPVGLGGTKKVSDILIDAHVPRCYRPFYPIITDSTGRIIWVAGLAVDKAVRLSGTGSTGEQNI